MCFGEADQRTYLRGSVDAQLLARRVQDPRPFHLMTRLDNLPVLSRSGRPVVGEVFAQRRGRRGEQPRAKQSDQLPGDVRKTLLTVAS